MKRSKDRLHKVIVIGATPAGVSATNKLGELGVPVTLVDTDGDMDQKLSRPEWTLKSGLPFNHAHRPGLVRMIRNPEIQCIMPAEVKSVKHTPQGFRVKIDKSPTFVDPDTCTLCGRCVDACPVNLSDGDKPVKIYSRRSLPGRAFIDKRKRPVCQEHCPLGVNVQGYVALTRAGRYAEALNLIRRDNILPGICGRVCTHPCESVCRRSDLDEPVAIRDIKRFLADYERTHPPGCNPEETGPARDEKIAVIGSGPAGLAAAADLARFGCRVTVFEKEARAGGLLRYAIGAHRLPKDILDLELEYIQQLGVTILTDHPVNLESDLDRMRTEFDAVIVAVGTWKDQTLGAPGEELAGVTPCLPFLKQVCNGDTPATGRRTAVIGGGNTAVDVARALVRLGSQPTILYRRRRQDMPADPDEIKAALEEGVGIRDCVQVVGFNGADGRMTSLECRPTRMGELDDRGVPRPIVDMDAESFPQVFDEAFVAIGQTGTLPADCGGMIINRNGLIEAGESLCAGPENVYAAGDAVSGPGSVVEAMALGRRVARSVCEKMSGRPWRDADICRPEHRDFEEIAGDIPFQPRPTMPERQPGVRKTDFFEVAVGLKEPQVLLETERCLQCGICSECLECVEACRALGAIRHDDQMEQLIEHAGVLIIADPDMAPHVKGEDIIRAYGPKASRADVYAMVVRGFSAAAQAMTLLRQTSNRPKGHGLSFSPPDPGLSPDIRIGVFVCRCNDSRGWLDGMSGYVAALESRKNVVHAEEITAACVPEGATRILRTVREKGITRLVLASCMCCSLNFACSACTEQRSRLKHFLFTDTGVSRSMVEACNLRGEVLRLVRKDPAEALRRFSGLLDRSLLRAVTLKALPSPARNYNFSTAVIGDSEASEQSVMTLAEAGMDVFWFGAHRRPVPAEMKYPNIQRFDESSVKGLTGTIGDFQLSIEFGDYHQSLQVGAVILDEKARKSIQYLQAEGLPVKVKYTLQKQGATGIPFFYPCATSIPGLFLSDPSGVNVSKRKKGAAAAVLAAAVMPRGPRHSKGFTVVVDETLCRGCGRCLRVCPYNAITMKKNDVGGWCASVDEALCKGCGNCLSVCPTPAADSPYRSQMLLESTVKELLQQQAG